jgi:putative PEP-CTERM system histidine kinase
MTLHSSFPFVAATACAALGVAALVRKRSIQRWCFFVGMLLLAIETALGGASVANGYDLQHSARLRALALTAKSLIPAAWLTFSLIYARGNSREFVHQWRFAIALILLVPAGLAIAFFPALLRIPPAATAGFEWWFAYGPAARALNIAVLLGIVLTLMNVESTFRASVGMMRWRIKFMTLGIAVIFGARIYTRTQALLYSGENFDMLAVETGSLIVGCILMAIALLRDGLAVTDTYPTTSVFKTSVTLILVGGYLFVVGVLSQLITFLGGAGNLPAQAFLILLGVAAVATLLMSDRLRQDVHRFVSRHFRRPLHDFRRIWTRFSHQLSSELTPSRYCATAAKLISETFESLAVTIWLVDEKKGRFVQGGTTSPVELGALRNSNILPISLLEKLREKHAPFDLDMVAEEWAGSVRERHPTQFTRGGSRICVPLAAGERGMGFAVLADRVNGTPYSAEEMDLLQCIGDQISAGLLNLQLNEDLMAAKELEAFQTMSAFFVHDLKNAASTLNLMLQNLPRHFDNPEFREDALRGIGKTVARINNMIHRLGVFRGKLDLKCSSTDLNALVNRATEAFEANPSIELLKNLEPLPLLLLDGEQIQMVITNLLLNARDAADGKARISIKTARNGNSAVLSVEDDGVGMTPEFIAESLFRPFHSSKNNGLGIGLFQSKVVVERHRGAIQVESSPGKGSVFRVTLPLTPIAE